MKKPFYVLLKGLYLSAVPLPILYFIAAKTETPLFPSILFMTLYSLSGYALSVYIEKRRLVVFLSLLAASVLCAVFILPYRLWNIVMVILSVAVLSVGTFHNLNDEATRLIDTRILAAGLTVAAIFYFVAFVSVQNAVMPVIGYTAYVFLCVSLILVNRSTVRQNTGRQQKRILQGNQAMTAVFLVLLTVLAFITPISRAIGNAVKWVIAQLYSLFDHPGESAMQDTSGGEMMGDMFEALGGQDKVLPHWVEVAGNILLYVLTVAGLLGILAFLVWAISKFAKEIWQKLKALFARDNGEFDDYTEESEQMVSSASLGKMFRDEVRNRIRKAFTPPVHFSSLSAREKVRYLYQKVLSEGEKVTSDAQSMTPQELCGRLDKEKEFGELYDKVRYSDHEIKDSEATRFREYLKS